MATGIIPAKSILNYHLQRHEIQRRIVRLTIVRVLAKQNQQAERSALHLLASNSFPNIF